MACNTLRLRPGGGRKRPRVRGGYANRAKQEVYRLQAERDADHAALRTAVQLSGHLVLGPGAVPGASSSSAAAGHEGDTFEEGKGKGQQKGKKGGKKRGR